jgi:Asp-tRNA(Asn)/Glu-tRNA(Gln) amidotransferase A subunit family amidase
MAAFDADDAVSYRHEGASLLAMTRGAPPAPPVLAFVKTPAWNDTDPALRDAFAQLIDRLGNRVREIDVATLADIMEWARIVQLVENAQYYGPIMTRAPELISDGLRQRLESGAKVDPNAYQRALAAREEAYRGVAAVLDEFAAILTPAALGPAPASLASTGSPIMNALWTYLGMPTVSLPLLEANGMPVGVQLVGTRRGDGALLRTARWLTEAL